MENIFQDAYFGKPYKTRDGRKFVYLGKVESLFGHDSAIQGMIEDNDILTYYNSEGKSLYCEYQGSAINAFDIDFSQVVCEEDCGTDIVSELQEVNEEELDKLAKSTSQYDDGDKILYKDSKGCYTSDDLDVAFKAGYLARGVIVKQ